MGPLLFSIFINDFEIICQKSHPYLYADDGALYFNNISRENLACLKDELYCVLAWLRANKLAISFEKTKFIIFDKNDNLETLNIKVGMQEYNISECKVIKYLGLHVDNKLKFKEHIEHIIKKVTKRIGAMYRGKNLLPIKYRKMFANSLILPLFDYLDIIYNHGNKTDLKCIDIAAKHSIHSEK